jgi:flagellin
MKNLANQFWVNRDLKTTMERLSSGMRINRGADDPAGLAISESMRAHYRGIDVAIENAQEALIWMEGRDRLMEEQLKMAMRLKELSVRAANEATLTDSDRQKMNDEAQALIAEIDKVGKYSSMNGSVDSGGTGGTQYLFGPGELDVVWVFDRTGSMGSYITAISNAANTMFTQFKAKGFDLRMSAVGFNGTSLGAPPVAAGSVTLGNYGNAADRAITQGDFTFYSDAVSFTSGGQGVDALTTAGGTERGMDAVVEATERYTAGTPGDAFTFRTDAQKVIILITDADSDDQGSTGSGNPVDVDASLENQVLSALNASGITCMYAGNVDENLGNPFYLRDSDYEAIANGGSFDLDPYYNPTPAPFDLVVPATTWVNQVTSALSAYGGDYEWSFQVGPDNLSEDRAAFEFRTITARTTKLSGVSLTSVSAAQNAISTVDAGIEYIAQERATTGAYMHRIEAVINDLTAERINTTAAKSKIADTDIAETATGMTKQQIILNTAVAAGLHANATPSAVLNLISEQGVGQDNALLV